MVVVVVVVDLWGIKGEVWMGCWMVGAGDGAERERGWVGTGGVERKRVRVGEEGGGLPWRALRLLLLRDAGAESLVICTCFFPPSGDARSRLNSADFDWVRGGAEGEGLAVSRGSPRTEGITPGLSTGVGEWGVGEMSGENIAPLFLLS